MKNHSGWKSAFKIGIRDARSSLGKFCVVLFSIAAGVGAITGVRGFSSSFQETLLRDARTLMAADLSVHLFNELSPEQKNTFSDLAKRGIQRTWVTETVSMMSSKTSSQPILVSVKAIEPDRYPFYGEIRLMPQGKLSEVLSSQNIVVSNDLLIRLGIKIGDWVQLGDEQFQLAAEVVFEPDRMSGMWNVGPRVMVTRTGLSRSGLIRPGSRASQRYLFQLPKAGIKIDEVRNILEAHFLGDRIVDFRESNPTLSRGLDRSTKFLSLISLISLIVGAVGVSMTMHSHMQQRLDTIAIMKCLGGRSHQIMRIFLIQTALIGLIGSSLGVVLGYVVQTWFPYFIQDYFPNLSALQWQPIVAVQGLLIGLLITLLFTMPTLLSTRKVRPALVFRREMARRHMTPRKYLNQFSGTFYTGSVIFVTLVVLGMWLSESPILGIWFSGGLLISFVGLMLVSWLFLKVLRSLPYCIPWKLPSVIRQGLANLHRPGNNTKAVLVSLGIGVMFTMTVYLIQSSVISQMVRSAPPEMPNVFFVNVMDAERNGLVELLNSTKGVEGRLELVPSVAARILSIDRKSIEEFTKENNLAYSGATTRQRLARTRTITWQSKQPEYIEVLEGKWWNANATTFKTPLVSVSKNMAESLGIKLNSRIEWKVGGITVSAIVSAIHRGSGIRPGATIGFILSPGALEGFPTSYYGGVRVSTEKAIELQHTVFEHFPTVTVINAVDVLEIVQNVVDQIALVIRFVSVFTIFGGVVILASGVTATRFRRIREVAILKTLGASRNRIVGIFSTEFLVIGTLSGLIGVALASLFSSTILQLVLDTEYRFDLIPLATTVVITAVLANTAGWLSSLRILSKKPLEVLRSE